MPINPIVVETVKRMISTGVDDETIRATLKSIDLSNEEIETIIENAKTDQVPKEKKEEPTKESEEPEEIEEEMPHEEIKKEIKSVAEEQLAAHTTTHNILEEHQEKLGEVHKSVSEISEKIENIPKIDPETIAKLSALDYRISELEKEINETKAIVNATQSLLQKILETNREILLELQKKK
ncbi:MAG: hypothetical protein QXU92_02795 [Candidatus Diapherotrites archaeon]